MGVSGRNLYVIVLCTYAFNLHFLPAEGSHTGLDKDEAPLEQDPSPIGANIREASLPGRVRQRRGLTYAGTLWCGPGDSAGGDDEALGTEREADSCCRQHDKCPSKVKRYKRNYHYFNWRPYTISNCECDNTFKDCLLAANTTTADTVGDWFFNRLDLACFELVYENVCVDREWWGGCKRYAMDYVAHTTSAGPYVWWLKNRPTPNPDIDHFNENKTDLSNVNNNGDGLETATSNGSKVGTENGNGKELESQSDNDNSLETITSDGMNPETAEGNDNEASSVTQILNSLGHVLKGGLKEETVTQTVNDENTEMSNVIPNDVN